MRRLLAVATFGILAGLVGVQPSAAAVPSPTTSFVSPCFVSCPQGDLDFTVDVRDAANNPQDNSSVILDFSSCPDVKFCAIQESGTSIDPNLRYVGRISDAFGHTVFHVHMGGLCPGAKMKVTADGVPLAFRNVASTDQDGNLLVEAADQTLVAGKVGGTDASADFDCNGTVDSADVAIFAGHLGHACEATTPALPRSWGEIKVIYR